MPRAKRELERQSVHTTLRLENAEETALWAYLKEVPVNERSARVREMLIRALTMLDDSGGLLAQPTKTMPILLNVQPLKAGDTILQGSGDPDV